MLHPEILSQPQRALLPLVKKFRDGFGLVGGTALALHLGHRESIDFDLFTLEPLRHSTVRQTIVSVGTHIQSLIETPDEYTVLVDGVKLTFLRYPFALKFPVVFEDIAVLPDVLTLAAMKAYALGRRAKWKDYVDLFFVMKAQCSLGEIIRGAEGLFGDEFSEKNFRSQLAYFQDIDYSEKVVYRPGFETDDQVVRSELGRMSLATD